MDKEHITPGDTTLEPWMRGYLRDLDPVLASILYSLQQIREDVAKWTAELSDEQLWSASGDAAPAGFHLRHIAGSTDRLMTYASDESLSEQQMNTLRDEKNRDLTLAELQTMLERALQKAEDTVRATEPSQFGAMRALGRKRIPTTLIGLLIHTAEHAQRHLGAMITAVRTSRSAPRS